MRARTALEYPYFPLRGIDWDALGAEQRPRAEPSLILDVRPDGGGNDALALHVAARFAAAPVFFTAVEWISVSDAGVGSVAPPRPHGA